MARPGVTNRSLRKLFSGNDDPVTQRYFLLGIAVSLISIAAPFVFGWVRFAVFDPAFGVNQPLRRVTVVVSFGGVIVGGGLIGIAVARARTYLLISRSPANPESSDAPMSAAISGTISDTADTQRTPFTEQPAVRFDALMKEQTPRGRWQTKHSETAAVTFFLQTDSQVYEVNPAGLHLFDQNESLRERTIVVEESAEPPKRIQNWLWSRQLASGHRERRYIERWVEPGDDIFILGTVHPNGETGLSVNGDHHPRPLLTTVPPEKLLEELRSQMIRLVSIGIGLWGPSYGLLLWQLTM